MFGSLRLDHRSIKWLIATILSATAFLYLPSFSLGFISDDFALIGEARRVSWWGLFLQELNAYYRPLVQLTLKADHALWGSKPAGYHVTSFALHLINVLLVALIGRRVLSRKGWILAAVYFGITPTHASSVLWICGRTDLLCATFYLGTAWMLIESKARREMWHGAIVALLTFGALLSKEMAISLPLVSLLIAYAIERRDGHALRDSAVAVAPIFCAFVLYIALRFALFGNFLQNPLQTATSTSAILTNVARYAVTLTFPLDLEILKPFFRSHPNLLLGASVVIAGGCIYFARSIGRDRTLLVLLGCVALSLIPVLRVFGPWYLYIPSVGVALFVGRAFELVERGIKRKAAISWALVLLLGLQISGLGQRQLWAFRAGKLTSEAIETLAVNVDAGNRVAVLSLPTEYRGVPVFGWLGNLEYAMHLFDHDIGPLTAVGVRLSGSTVETETIVESSKKIRMSISGETDFFRLHDLRLLTGARKPAPGQIYNVRDATVEVVRLNASGQPAEVVVTPRTFGLRGDVKIFAFRGSGLQEITVGR